MIYLIRAGETWRYKLGHTDRSGEHRRRDMQGSNYDKLRVVTWWPGTWEQEQRMHRLLTPWRGDGGKEWYKLTPCVLIEEITRKGVRPPKLEDAQDPVAQLLPPFVLAEHFERLPPIPVPQADVDARIRQNIQDYYYDHGPWHTDGGTITVGKGAQDLLTSGLVDCDLWKPYTLQELRLAFNFDLTERYGAWTCLDELVDEGVIEVRGEHYRVNPLCEDASLVWEMALPEDDWAT